MPSSLPTDVLGWASLAALVLLPGVLVVRSPWTHVPLLSVAFWVVTWWWLPLARLSRERFLPAALLVFALLAGLRLLRTRMPSLPPWSVLVVVLAALARLLPYGLWIAPPGVGTAPRAEAALLLTWRDGVPASHEPFSPAPLGAAEVPGVASVAADLSLLSGLPAPRATLLSALAGLGLLQVALFAALAPGARPGAAALGAVSALALPSLPQGLLAADPAPLLCLALLLGAGALLARPGGRGSAVAAGVLWAGAAVSDPLEAGLAILLVPALFRGGRGAPGPGQGLRLGLAAAVAVILGAPFAIRLASGGLPWGGNALLGTGAQTGAPLLDRAFLACALAGLLLRAVRTPPRSLAGPALSLVLLILAGRLPSLVATFGQERWESLLAVALAAGLVGLVGAFLEHPGALRRLALVAFLALSLEGARRSWVEASSDIVVSEDDLRAMAWLQAHTGPQDVVCGEEGPTGHWIPALAARAVRFPAAQLGPETAAGAPCTWRYLRGFKVVPAGAVFTSGEVALVPASPASLHRLTSPGGT